MLSISLLKLMEKEDVFLLDLKALVDYKRQNKVSDLSFVLLWHYGASLCDQGAVKHLKLYRTN